MHIFDLFMEFLYPPRCPSCRSYVKHEGDWCLPCMQKAVQVHPVALPPDSVLEKVWALGRYHGTMRRLIINLKYNGKMSALRSIHKYITAAAISLRLPACEYLTVCVPLHKKRLEQRGFNQTELIFKKWIAENSRYFVDCLERTYFTQRQYKLSRTERFQNMQNTFSLKTNFNAAGKVFLLLDDIYTTGATMESCARHLRSKGAAAVYGLVLASDA